MTAETSLYRGEFLLKLINELKKYCNKTFVSVIKIVSYDICLSADASMSFYIVTSCLALPFSLKMSFITFVLSCISCHPFLTFI